MLSIAFQDIKVFRTVRAFRALRPSGIYSYGLIQLRLYIVMPPVVMAYIVMAYVGWLDGTNNGMDAAGPLYGPHRHGPYSHDLCSL